MWSANTEYQSKLVCEAGQGGAWRGEVRVKINLVNNLHNAQNEIHNLKSGTILNGEIDQ